MLSLEKILPKPMVPAVLKRSQVEEISFSQLLWRLTEELAWQALSLPVAVSSQVQVRSWTSDAVVVSFLDWPCGCGRSVTSGGKGGTIPRVPSQYGAPNHCGGAEKSHKCYKYFLQCNEFAFERAQVRTWGRQTCFLPRAPSNLVTPLGCGTGL